MGIQAEHARPASRPEAPGVRQLRVVAADPDPLARAAYRDALAPLGHAVECVATARQLTEACVGTPPDVVIVDARLSGACGELVEAVCRERPVPVVVAAEPGSVGAAGGPHVLAWLVKPVRAADVAAVAGAVRCFGQLAALRAEAAELRRALEDRKVIERAKGAVTRRCAVTEPEAYRRLRKLATDGGRRLSDVAQQVLEAEDVFHALDGLAAD
jgi:response regulator NasT